MKTKTLIQKFIFSQLIRVTRLFTKAKSVLIEIVEEARLKNIQILVSLLFKKNKNKKKLSIGSFRFRYNTSPSHFVPKGSIYDAFIDYVCDPKWDSFEEDVAQESQLSGYLHWLEEKNTDSEIIEVEINDLAERFIVNCHEKFALEKQESDRRFQEMMARSL
ncbi:uncharacterized protein LOC143634186 [Bidens hawaiensis]|uniref:uncharacterized protein LOC143634186 n=1 Tax=Bidens hawaiensis TaxID=980011 RepID=UPI00404ADC7C